jgi:hypothetical protein
VPLVDDHPAPTALGGPLYEPAGGVDSILPPPTALPTGDGRAAAAHAVAPPPNGASSSTGRGAGKATGPTRGPRDHAGKATPAVAPEVVETTPGAVELDGFRKSISACIAACR